MSRRAAWGAVALILMHATCASASGSSRHWTLDEQAGNRRRYFDHIATMDVVFEGRVDSCRSTLWVPRGPCQGKSSSQDALDVTIDVTRMLVGTVRGPIVRWRTTWSQDAAAQLVPGTPILAWGYRDECDDGTPWGVCLAIGADGRFLQLFSPDWGSIGDWSDARPPTLAEFEPILLAGRTDAERFPLANADSLVLVRALGGRTWSADPPRAQVRVESVGRAGVGHGKRFWVTFDPRRNTIWKWPAEGDSLLLPARHGPSVRSREYRTSPQPCRVCAGYVPGVDAPLSEVAGIR